MKLKKVTGRDQVTWVYIVESYRGEDGKTRQRTVESLGRLDRMLAADPDGWVKAQARCDELTAERKSRRGVLEYDTTLPWDGGTVVNVGWVLVDAVLRRLGVVRVARAGRGRNGAEQGVDLAGLVRLLVASRVVAPGSKLAAWEGQDRLLGGPRVEDLSQVYRGLEEIARLAARFQQAAWQGRGGGSLATVDYDVTNYFFHVDAVDPDPVGKTAGRGEATRQRGYSKEHRSDPIIQMGLFLDAEGIPVSYRLFDGNVPDMSTMAGALTEFKQVFNPGRVVVVADKGLNTSVNLIQLADDHDGWVVAASHRKSRETRDWLLDPTGWSWNPDRSVRTKSRILTHVIKTKIGQEWRQVEVTEKFVASWSQQAKDRDQATRAELLAKAELLTSDEARWRAGTKRGARKYLTVESVDPATGEITTRNPTLLTVNHALADDEALLDGYHMIRTSETHLTDSQIIERYHQLWRIEHAFRVSKTDLEARPVYVRLPVHIEAHFLICFLALLVTRLLQHLTGLPIGQLIDAIKNFQAMPCADGVYRLQRPGWQTIDQATGVPFDQTWATITQIRAWTTQLNDTFKTLPLPT